MTRVDRNRTPAPANTRAQSPTAASSPPSGTDVEAVPTPSSAPVDAVEPSRARTTQGRPFNPPPSPVLLDETRAKGSDGAELARQMNAERITAYNREYDAYLQRFSAAVDTAPSLEAARAFGKPAPYEPITRLPVSQRGQYDHQLASPSMQNQATVYEAMTRLERKLAGKEMPGVYAFAEGSVSVMGQGIKGRVDGTSEGVKGETAFVYGAGTDMLKDPELLSYEGVEGAIGVSTEVDPSTGEAVHTVSVDAGAFGVEADSHGRVAYTVGRDAKLSAFDTEASAKGKIGSAYDGEKARTELFATAGAEIGDALAFEVTVGAGAQLLSKEYVRDVIDPSGRDTFDEVGPQRAGGR